MIWVGEVEDAQSIDDLITSASIAGRARNLISRLQADSGKSQQETLRSKSPQPKAKLNQRRDTAKGKAQSVKRSLTGKQIAWMIYDFFQKLVATMKPSWTSEIYQMSN